MKNLECLKICRATPGKQKMPYNNDNIYCHYYKTLLAPVNTDIEFGCGLSKAGDPNNPIEELLLQSNAQSYTVGSKSIDTFAGFACICLDLNVEIKRTLEKNAVVYTAECIAFQDAINIV